MFFNHLGRILFVVSLFVFIINLFVIFPDNILLISFIPLIFGILSFIFLTIYCILLKLNTNSRINKKVVVSLISLIVIGELMINAYSCLTLQSYAPRKYIYNYIIVCLK